MGGLPAKGQNLLQICFNRIYSRASPLLQFIAGTVMKEQKKGAAILVIAAPF